MFLPVDCCIAKQNHCILKCMASVCDTTFFFSFFFFSFSSSPYCLFHFDLVAFFVLHFPPRDEFTACAKKKSPLHFEGSGNPRAGHRAADLRSIASNRPQIRGEENERPDYRCLPSSNIHSVDLHSLAVMSSTMCCRLYLTEALGRSAMTS